MEARPYQQDVIKKTIEAFDNYRSVCIVAGTGSGKTVMSTNVIAHYVNLGWKVLFIVDRDNLVNQSAKTFLENGINFGYIKAGFPETPSAQVQIASAQTLEKRTWWKDINFNLIVIDEAHEITYRKIVLQIIDEIYKNSKVLGLTATPYTNKKRKLGDIFQKGVYAPVPSELMKEGYLVENSYFSIGEVNLAGVKTANGDYVSSDLSVACDRQDLIEQAVKKYKELAFGRRFVAFCIDVEHAKHVEAEFKRQGVPCALVTGKTPTDTRNIYYKAVRDLECYGLVSVGCLTKGFDEASVEVNIMLRPSKSRSLIEQMLGRTMRISPKTGKTVSLVLDQAGNIRRLAQKWGLVENIKRYRLETSDDEGEANPTPMKECPQCGKLHYGFVMECDACGYKFPSAEKKDIDTNLVRIFKDDVEEEMFKWYQNALKLSYDKGYKPYYATELFKTRYRRYPRWDWGYGAIFPNPSEEDYNSYLEYQASIARKDGKVLMWIHKNLNLEFGDNYKERLANNPLYQRIVAEFSEPKTLQIDKTLWVKIINSITTPASQALFKQQSRFVRVDNDKLIVRCCSQALLRLMAANMAHLETAVKQVVGQQYGVKIIL